MTLAAFGSLASRSISPVTFFSQSQVFGSSNLQLRSVGPFSAGGCWGGVAKGGRICIQAGFGGEMTSIPAEPYAYPLHRCKIIHVVRHGQGFHNVAGEENRQDYESWDYFDSSLTPLGWEQVDALHEHVRRTHARDSVELVVVSPLLRTMQTAAGVFGSGDLHDGETEHSALMVAGVGQVAHAPISSSGAPPFIAVEWCREHNGIHPCDKRQSVSFYRTKFPAVDFSEVETDEDTWWKPYNRETDEELYTRARTFVQWLLNRKEKEIAVVSHSSFIYHMLHLFGEDCSDVVKQEMYQGFRNCEMRSLVLADRHATAPAKIASTDFAGGILNATSSVGVSPAQESEIQAEAER